MATKQYRDYSPVSDEEDCTMSILNEENEQTPSLGSRWRIGVMNSLATGSNISLHVVLIATYVLIVIMYLKESRDDCPSGAERFSGKISTSSRLMLNQLGSFDSRMKKQVDWHSNQ